MMGLCASISCGGRHCPTAAMRPYSQHQSTQQSANMLGNKLVLLKLGKIIANYVFFLTLRHNALTNCWILFVAGHDGCTTDAEHWRGQPRHIYIVYVPPHAPCPWLGMSAMFRAMAAEVWWLLISSQDLGGAWDGTCASLAPPHCFLPRFFHFTWVGTVLGHQIHDEGICRTSFWNTLNYSLQSYY
jgi:hypothetical protein